MGKTHLRKNQIYNQGMTDSRPNRPDPTQPNRPRRPFLLMLLFWVFVFWSILGWLRFTQALTERTLILELMAPGFFWYLLLAGLISGLAGLPALWGLMRGALWAPTVIWLTAAFYPALYWFERLFLWADPNAQRNWPFMLLLTGIWFGLVVWAQYSKRSRRYFNQLERDEV